MPDYNRLSREKLDARLEGVPGEADRPWWNDRLRFAHQRGKITDLELERSLSRQERVIKRYLWSIATDPEVRSRLRLFSVVTSKLWHRLGALVNMCAVEAGANLAANGELEALLCGERQNLMVAFLHERSNRTEPLALVKRVLAKYPQVDALAPRDTSVLSCWRKAKAYTVGKYITAVSLHIRTHFLRRLKASLRSKGPHDFDAAMKYLYGGEAPSSAETKRRVDAVVERLKLIKKWKAGAPDVSDDEDSGERISLGLLRWHLELCREEGAKIQPFPLANTVSRVYVRVDSVIFDKMFHDRPLAFREALGLTRELWNSRRKPPRAAARKKETRNLRRAIPKLRDDEVISSVETDGYGVSIVIKRAHSKQADKKDPKQWSLERLEELGRLRRYTKCVVQGLDPGRVNLAVTASKVTEFSMDGPEDVKHWVFSRAKWNSKMGERSKREWECARREVPAVKAALDALSESGGKRNAEAPRWTAYLDATVAHWGALVGEFMESDERAARRMVFYRRNQRIIERVASRVVQPSDPRPLIVGYGDGSFASHGRGSSDTSVPVKKIYRAILRAFKTHRKRGGVLKVWEYFTTAKCHRCESLLEKPQDEEGNEIRDFRRCATCTHEERPKMRNRDFNAARNILKATEAMLLGAERPGYLCPEPRVRARVARVSRKRRSAGEDVLAVGETQPN